MTQKFGTSVLSHPEPMESTGFQVIQVPRLSVNSVMTAYIGSSLVEYAEPDYRISLEPSQTEIKIITQAEGSSPSMTPDDPEFEKLWGLHNTGQSPFNGKLGADISAEEAWKYSTGSSEIVVAVLDSGVDYTHPDLAENIWTNPGEIPDNGIDDDGNGFIDDVHGWNFQGNNNSVMDDNGHGTHCAGIIGAIGDNHIGVTGVNWKVRIMPLKFMDNSGNGYISDAVSAILYANRMGADVISCSWSGTQYSNALEDAISASPSIVVCAAGNGGSDDDSTPIYPATNDCPNIITVAATDASDNLASFSNYGVKSVDIAAPGVEIASTYPGNQYAYMSGTSMATPYVSGVAALLKSINPTLTNIQMRSILLTSSDILSSLDGKVSSLGRLNAYKTISQVSGSTNVQQSIPTPTPTSIPVQTIPILSQSSPYPREIYSLLPPGGQQPSNPQALNR
ncbi:MAG: S8 family peptidase [Methanobacteriota archaeon]